MARFRAGGARDELLSFGIRQPVAKDREEHAPRQPSHGEPPGRHAFRSSALLQAAPVGAAFASSGRIRAECFRTEPGTPYQAVTPNTAKRTRGDLSEPPSRLEPVRPATGWQRQRSSRPSSGRPRDNSSRFDD